jgi:hypothetical protein
LANTFLRQALLGTTEKKDHSIHPRNWNLQYFNSNTIMSAWGVNGSARSCDALLTRVEANDPTLTELVILPLKTFGSKDLHRLTKALRNNSHLTSLQASGHAIDDLNALEELGKALSTLQSSIVELAVGDTNMGDIGVSALCRGLKSSNKNLMLRKIDLSWKNM